MSGANYQSFSRLSLLSVKISSSFITIFILISLLLSGCNEKIPALQVESYPVDFDYIVVSSADISDTTQRVEPDLGSGNFLLSGQNPEISTFSLIKFNELSSVPDTLDSLISIKLQVYPHDQLFLGSQEERAVSVSAMLLQCPTGSNWSEDSTNHENFLLDFTTTILDTITYDPSDTNVSFLEFILPDSIFAFWKDTTSTNCGIMLSLDDGEQDIIQAFRSSEYYGYSPAIYFDYIEDGDTLDNTLFASEDVSIIDNLTFTTSYAHLRFNNSLSDRSFLRFELPDTILDQNSIIGKAYLHLTIDTVESVNYDAGFRLYFSLLDSAEAYNAEFEPSGSTSYPYKDIAPGDTAAVIDLRWTVQTLNSGVVENFGMVIWSSSSNWDVSRLSLFGYAYPDISKRPYLEILAMREM